MYFIHPRQLSVRLPRDCNDDDLAMGEVHEPIPTLRPTSMTYFLERVRLAHLCREMVDTVPLETSRLEQVPYEHIIALDKRLLDYISSLPSFFSLDAESLRRTKPLEAVYPNMPLQRYYLTRTAYSRRCKLHQRFLLRQASNPRYAYSRQACLESARAVLDFNDDFPGDNSSWIVMARMGIAMHFMNFAVVVLVMDLCFNRHEADEAEVKAEVRSALQLFEDNKHASPLLGRFLSSLRHVLQKHQVYLTDRRNVTANHGSNAANVPGPNPFVYLDSDRPQYTDPTVDALGPDLGLDSSFDDFWQDVMQGEPNFDVLAWDNLFSELDMRPL